MAEMTEQQVQMLEELVQTKGGDIGGEKARIYFPLLVSEVRRLRSLVETTKAAESAAASAREREKCAKVAEAWARHYPTHIFLPGSPTTDGIAAEMARHTSRMIAEAIRENSGG